MAANFQNGRHRLRSQDFAKQLIIAKSLCFNIQNTSKIFESSIWTYLDIKASIFLFLFTFIRKKNQNSNCNEKYINFFRKTRIKTVTIPIKVPKPAYMLFIRSYIRNIG